MRANGGAVADLGIAILRRGDVDYQPAPFGCSLPSREAVAAAGVGGAALRQVPPRRTRAHHPENTNQNAAIIRARHAHWCVWQQRRDYAPLEVS